jgi:hypothetical protein
MQDMITTKQTRIDQNRVQTKALIMQRLVQSHRDHKDVAAKRIARRLAVRRVIRTMVAVPTLAISGWLAMDLLGVEIVRAQSREIIQPVPVARELEQSPSSHVLTQEARPATELANATTTSEISLLRFEYELSKPTPAATTP